MDNSTSYILFQGVLNDDIVYIANKGFNFKGGYVAVIEYYTFLNEWNNRKHLRYFRTLNALEKYIAKKYPNADIEICQMDNE